MVKSMENGSLVPPFLLKCYEMVDDQSTNDLISWGKTGDSFVIWNQTQFQSEILPQNFKHNNFSSFVRQLNIYGFRKIDTDQWEFANEGFIKGQKHFLKNIFRRKQSQNRNHQQNSSQDDNNGDAKIICEDGKKTEIWKEIETLSTDKKALTEELILLSQHQQTSEKKLLVLRDQLKGMEENQQQMLSFIVMAMQNPGFFVQLLQPKETNWSRMSETGKNAFKRVFDEDDDETNDGSDGMIVRYQTPKDESMNYLSPPENSQDLDLSSDEVKDMFMNIDFTPMPFDEKYLSMDNFFLPNFPEGGESMLEQLLLSSSSYLEENKEEGCEKKSDVEEETNLEMGLNLDKNDSANMELMLSECNLD
ncbi:heat stress transcription factor A-8 [Impatiens glandulifera]|uniref:heat stress transcription factor A-8 n=1 Tax=Impatiens glandulifera TaxID=253017 RepID=UPI001FB05D2B|nr:heat stress transcription factor A-8 [Impatiens glandulifera]